MREHRESRRTLVRRIGFLARYAHQPFDAIMGRGPTLVELAWFEAEITKLLAECPPVKFG